MKPERSRQDRAYSALHRLTKFRYLLLADDFLASLMKRNTLDTPLRNVAALCVRRLGLGVMMTKVELDWQQKRWRRPMDE